MSQTLTTQTVRPQERLSYWIDAVCSTYVHIDCAVPKHQRDMRGTINVKALDLLELTVSRSEPQRIQRTPEKIARYGGDYFLLQMPAYGASVVEQAGRRAELRPGDFTLYDCTRPFDIHLLENFEGRFLKIPGALLREQVPMIERLTATTVPARSGAGSLIRAIFDQIYEQGTPIARTARAGTALSDALVHIVVAGLATLPEVPAARLPKLTGFHLERARQYVHGHLGDPQLSPARIAAAIGVSPSHLHRLFRTQPQSLMQYIWQCRLERCRQQLADPHHAHRSIGEIAFGAGFSDPAHFSRSFRKAFGGPARDWRQGGASGSARRDAG